MTEDYYENGIRVAKFQRHFQFKRLREKIDPKAWIEFEHVTVVNAFYHPNINTIVMTAGILQGIFYNSKFPNYINYGATGAVIGHEITHGFDDQGRRRDYNGRKYYYAYKYYKK